MRIGVIGCGYWGAKHVRVLHQMTDIDRLVVVDPRADRRTALTRSFPALTAFAEVDAGLDQVDAVVIATPPSTHVELASEALLRGRHVLVEKPMSTTAAGARQLIDLAASAGLTLMVGHTFEYNAAVWRLREAVRTGELGSLHYIDTARLSLGLCQADINVVWDLAPHDISIINYLLGVQPDTVTAWAFKHAHSHLEDVAYLSLHYAALGVTAQVHVSWLDPCKVRRVTVVGSRKMLVYNDLADQERIRIYDRGVVPASRQHDFDVPASYRYGDITAPFIALQEPLSVQDQHFVDCVRNGTRPSTDGESGLAVVQVLEAVQLSLRRKAPVPVDTVRSNGRARPEEAPV
jgi:predicted dehydrogenase